VLGQIVEELESWKIHNIEIFLNFKIIKSLNFIILGRRRGFETGCDDLGISGVNFANILRVAFFVWYCFAKFFSTYSLQLYIFGNIILAQKLLIICWWNWLQGVPKIPIQIENQENSFRWKQVYRKGLSSSTSSGQFPLLYYIK